MPWSRPHKSGSTNDFDSELLDSSRRSADALCRPPSDRTAPAKDLAARHASGPMGACQVITPTAHPRRTRKCPAAKNGDGPLGSRSAATGPRATCLARGIGGVSLAMRGGICERRVGPGEAQRRDSVPPPWPCVRDAGASRTPRGDVLWLRRSFSEDAHAYGDHDKDESPASNDRDDASGGTHGFPPSTGWDPPNLPTTLDLVMRRVKRFLPRPDPGPRRGFAGRLPWRPECRHRRAAGSNM